MGTDSVRVRSATDSEDDLVLRVTPLDADGYAVDEGASFLIPVRGGKARNHKSKLRKLANAL